jgi:chromosome segregation ATPase
LATLEGTSQQGDASQEAQVRELQGQLGALRGRLAERGEELAASEERGAALEERLAAALARAELQEAGLREELRRAAGSLSSNRRSAGALQEEAGQLQRVLAASQEDRRVLQVTGRSPRDSPPRDPRLGTPT